MTKSNRTANISIILVITKKNRLSSRTSGKLVLTIKTNKQSNLNLKTIENMEKVSLLNLLIDEPNHRRNDS